MRMRAARERQVTSPMKRKGRYSIREKREDDKCIRQREGLRERERDEESERRERGR
jgi:hypothetical protein